MTGVFNKLYYLWFIGTSVRVFRKNCQIVINYFSDCITHNVILWFDYITKENNREAYWNRKIYPITTDPGFKSRTNPMNNSGCAILAPNQYRGCWTFGYHKGRYEALVQTKPVKVYRDNNKERVVRNGRFKSSRITTFETSNRHS